MPQSLKLVLRSSIFDKEKSLSIEPNFMEFENINLSKFEIAELRYGIKAINGYRFRIGRIYCIDIKSLDGRILKIRLKSLYRIRKIHLEEKYFRITRAILDNYINDISLEYINRFRNKIDFKLLGNTFEQEGIRFEKSDDLIPWADLGTKNYWTYFCVFSKSNADRYRPFSYLEDWNSIVLKTVLKYILK